MISSPMSKSNSEAKKVEKAVKKEVFTPYAGCGDVLSILLALKGGPSLFLHSLAHGPN